MTTIKIKFRASTVHAKEGTLYLQVIHSRVVRQISTGFKLFPSEWNSLNSTILLPEDTSDSRRGYLVSLQDKLRRKTRRLQEISSQMTNGGQPFTADALVEAYLNDSESNDFMAFIRNRIAHFTQIGRHSAAEKLQAALNSFTLFLNTDHLPFSDVTARTMEAYESHLKEKGVCMNTSSFYMRTLRSVYNTAVEQGLTPQRNPFKPVYTGIDKTLKRAVSLRVIRQIRDLDLSASPSMDWARDLFLFSFYTRGMSFVDMAFLKKKNLQNGLLVYRRHKTNQQLTIRWEKPMQEIIDKYGTNATPYLLPIIRDIHSNARQQYKNAIHLVNAKLKKIGVEIGLGIPLTTYVARHGWASIAKCKNIPTATISEALGHNSEKTTRIYLAALDSSAVDRANQQILKLL